jgi:hypothetical protein
LASQLPYPAVQVGAHTPPVHAVEPLAFVQATPQVPQFATVLSCVSHPFEPNPSQLPQPALHVIEQAPAVHDAVPLVPTHALLQAPQWVMLVVVFVSQPFRTFPSQLAKPELHTGKHRPAAHEVVPLEFVQAWLHAPQLPRLVCVSVSQPFCTLPSQLPHPVLHTGTHKLATQEVVPCVFVHALAHVPQFAVEVWVLVSQPLLVLPSQLAYPALQVGEHTPEVHTVVPLALLQAVPQAPQFVTVLSPASHPFATLASQFP